MQSLSLLLAQVANGSAASAATDEIWQLEMSWRLAPWLTVLAVATMAAIVIYSYAKELSPAGKAYRGFLSGLRLVTLGLLLMMLTEMLLSGARSGRPRLAVVIDHSQSMSVVDPGADPGASRLNLVQAALTSEESALLEQLATEYEIDFYAAADRLAPLDPAAMETGQERWTEAIATVAIDDSSAATRLGDAIEQMIADPSGRAPQSVLIFSDGQVTAGQSLSAAAESARRASAPLYLVGVGAEQTPPDVALADLLAEEVVFVDDLVSFRATLRTSGDFDAPVRVTLQSETGQVLAEQTVSPTPDAGAVPVQLLYRPEQPGVFRFTLAAEVTGAETNPERNVENNILSHELSVRDQRVRVLLAAGGPSYEFRYLKHLLERDSTVELASFLQEADLEYAPADPTAVSRLPLRETELDEHDVVVLMDLDPRLVPRSFWPTLREFISESGGGLAMVAGPKYLPRAFGGLPDFAALFPVELDSAGLASTASAGAGFRVTPTPIGLARAALQLADDTPSTTLAWQRLPPLYWHAELGDLKPAAQVLAQHPSATRDGAPAPLIVSQYFGSGQVVLHAIDSTYRWRRQTGDVYFARYWVQTLRALARGRLAAGSEGVQLTVDRQRYESGEPIRLRLRAGALQANTKEQTVLIQPESGPQLRVTLQPASDQRGVAEATLDRLPVGRYRALLTDGSAENEAATTFEVVAPPGEFAQLEMAAGPMQSAAEHSRGAFVPLGELSSLVDKLPPARRAPIESLPPVELWNRWWMLAAVCGCLTTEWILRKRKAML